MFLQVQNHISVKPFETDLIKYRPLESHRHVPTREKPFAFGICGNHQAAALYKH